MTIYEYDIEKAANEPTASNIDLIRKVRSYP